MSMTTLLGRFARGLLSAVGVSVFALGLLVVFVPGTGEYFPMEALIETLGSDYIVVAALGIAVFGFSVFAVLFRRLTGVEEAVTPIVEGVQSAPIPGASFDRRNDGLFGTWTSDSARNRLREAAIQSLMRSERCSRSTATQRVEEGSWTDDVVAARFLGNTHSEGRFGSTFAVRDRIERTIEAIEAINRSVTRGRTVARGDGDHDNRDGRRVRESVAARTVDTDDRGSEGGHGTVPAEGD